MNDKAEATNEPQVGALSNDQEASVLSGCDSTSFAETTYDSDIEKYDTDDSSDWSSETSDTGDFSDWSSEEDLSYDLNSPFLPESSLLVELDLPLIESEKNLIDEFYQEMEAIEQENDREYNARNPSVNCTESALKRIKSLTDKYLNKGIRLNSCYGDDTITDFIFKKINGILDYSLQPIHHQTHAYSYNTSLYHSSLLEEKAYEQDEFFKDDCLDIIKIIIKDLLLKGGKVKRDLFCYDIMSYTTYGYEELLFPQCKKIKNKLQNIAYETIINERGNLKVEIDNGYFYVQYPQNSIVEVARITTNQEVKDLNLRYGILQIGKSIIRVENIEEKRNYTDIPEGSIKMSFTTVAGKINILLYPDKNNSNKVKVELDGENQKKFNKLKDKSSLGKNCLLGGKNIAQAIEDQEFTKNQTYTPSTFMQEISINHIFESLKNSFKQLGKYVLGG